MDIALPDCILLRDETKARNVIYNLFIYKLIEINLFFFLPF